MKVKPSILVVVTSICIFFAGCKQESMETMSKPLNNLVSDIEKTVNDLESLSYASSKDANAEEVFATICDVSYNKISEFYYAYVTNANADEILIVKVKDALDAKYIKDALKKRIELRIAEFQSYNAAEVDKLKNAQVISHVNYIALIVTSNPSAGKKLFNESFE